MSLDWQVLEEERMPAEGVRPPLRRGAARGARRVAGALGLLLLLLVSVGGGLGWRARVQDERLRADLLEVIWQEARLNATGDTRLFTPLLDPDAPVVWRVFYEELYRRGFTLPAHPTIRSLHLEEGGTLALVELEWPRPDDAALAAGAQATFVMPRHAYRLVGGRWRRTPWPLGESPMVEQSSPHFTVRGPGRDLAAVVSLSDLEALHEHLAQSWPSALLEPRHIIIEIQPQEFASWQRDERQAIESRTVRINTPGYTFMLLELPLTADSQYRFRATAIVVHQLVRVPIPPSMMPDTAAEDYVMFLYALKTAEALHWTLDEDEHRAFRNGLRAQLGGEWIEPSVMVALPNGTLAVRERWASRRDLARPLLLEWVVSEYGVDALGRMAHAAAASPPDTFDFDALLAATTGLPAAEAWQRARAYALTRE